MAEAVKEYPKWVYSGTEPARIVHSAEEEKSLKGSWSNTPPDSSKQQKAQQEPPIEDRITAMSTELDAVKEAHAKLKSENEGLKVSLEQAGAKNAAPTTASQQQMTADLKTVREENERLKTENKGLKGSLEQVTSQQQNSPKPGTPAAPIQPPIKR